MNSPLTFIGLPKGNLVKKVVIKSIRLVFISSMKNLLNGKSNIRKNRGASPIFLNFILDSKNSFEEVLMVTFLKSNGSIPCLYNLSPI